METFYSTLPLNKLVIIKDNNTDVSIYSKFFKRFFSWKSWPFLLQLQIPTFCFPLSLRGAPKGDWQKV